MSESVINDWTVIHDRPNHWQVRECTLRNGQIRDVHDYYVAECYTQEEALAWIADARRERDEQARIAQATQERIQREHDLDRRLSNVRRKIRQHFILSIRNLETDWLDTLTLIHDRNTKHVVVRIRRVDAAYTSKNEVGHTIHHAVWRVEPNTKGLHDRQLVGPHTTYVEALEAAYQWAITWRETQGTFFIFNEAETIPPEIVGTAPPFRHHGSATAAQVRQRECAEKLAVLSAMYGQRLVENQTVAHWQKIIWRSLEREAVAKKVTLETVNSALSRFYYDGCNAGSVAKKTVLNWGGHKSVDYWLARVNGAPALTTEFDCRCKAEQWVREQVIERHLSKVSDSDIIFKSAPNSAFTDVIRNGEVVGHYFEAQDPREKGRIAARPFNQAGVSYFDTATEAEDWLRAELTR